MRAELRWCLYLCRILFWIGLDKEGGRGLRLDGLCRWFCWFLEFVWVYTSLFMFYHFDGNILLDLPYFIITKIS